MTQRSTLPGYLATFSLGASEAWRDRAEMIGNFLTFGILLAIFAGVYAIMPIAELGVQGLEPHHLLWYFAITEIIIIGCPGMAWFGSEIADGKLSEMMQRPTNVALFVLISQTGRHIVASAILLALVMVVLPLFFAAPLPLLLPMLPFLLVSLILGIVLMQLMSYALSTFEVFGPYSRPLSWMISKMIFALGGLFLPAAFFPVPVRDIVMFTPFPSVVFMPGQFMLPFAVEAQLWGIVQQVFWIGVLAFVTQLTHRRMIKTVLEQGD